MHRRRTITTWGAERFADRLCRKPIGDYPLIWRDLYSRLALLRGALA